MADIFNEIDEDLRRDQLRRLWDRYSGLLLAVAVLIVLGVAGWRAWEYWQDTRAQAQGDQYVAALKQIETGDLAGAETNLEAFAKTADGGYPALAMIRAASARQQTGDAEGALKAFDAVAAKAGTPPLLADFARVRAGYIALDIEDRAKVEARVAGLDTATGAWRHSAREILAFAAWKAGDYAGASKRLDEIDADPQTPRVLAEHAKMLTGLITAATEKKAAGAAGSAPAAASTGKAP